MSLHPSLFWGIISLTSLVPASIQFDPSLLGKSTNKIKDAEQRAFEIQSVHQDSREEYGFNYLFMSNASALNHAHALLSWAVQPQFELAQKDCIDIKCPLNWVITKRNRESISSNVELTEYNYRNYFINRTMPSSGVYVEILKDLLPDTHYEFCLSVMFKKQLFYDKSLCKNLKTEERVHQLPSQASTATKVHEAPQSLENNELVITQGAQEINLSWRSLLANNNQHTEWKVRLRRFSESNESEIVLLGENENVDNDMYNYSITGLESNTPYVLCFEKIDNDHVTKSTKLHGDDDEFEEDDHLDISASSTISTAAPPFSKRQFVYTNTGGKVELPGTGPFIPGSFSVSKPVSFSSVDFPPPINDGMNPSLSPNFRNKRSTFVDQDPKNGGSKCYEIITNEYSQNDEILVSLMIAILISMFFTAITFLICCWMKTCYKNNSWGFKKRKSRRRFSSISSPVPTNIYNFKISSENKGERCYVKNLQSSACGLEKSIYDPMCDQKGRILMPNTFEDKPVECRKRSFNNDFSHNLPHTHGVDTKVDLQTDNHMDFHPGYDVPPTSTKKIVGYDYPCNHPVNTLDKPNERVRYPSCSESNWHNGSDSLSPSLAYNIPPVRKPSYVEKEVNYEYISRDDLSKHDPEFRPYNPYIEEAPTVRIVERKISYFNYSDLSRSAPNLHAIQDFGTSCSDFNSMQHNDESPVRVTHTPSIPRPVRIRKDISPKYCTVINTAEADVAPTRKSSASSDEEPARHEYRQCVPIVPSIGDITLSGGTLIEVPDGYVLPGNNSAMITVTVTGPDD